jgi:YD repeat-containing protein
MTTCTSSNAGNVTSFEGQAYAYNDAAHKHALTHINGVQQYWYDANGNATKRITDATYDLTYDAENRLTQLKKNGAVSGTHVYDGDGNRVKAAAGGTTTVYIGDYFEWTGSTATMKSYCYDGGTRVAMRTGTASAGGTVNYLLGDHLGSQTLTLTSAGGRLNTNTELRYYPQRLGALHRRHDADDVQLHRAAQGQRVRVAVLQRAAV